MLTTSGANKAGSLHQVAGIRSIRAAAPEMRIRIMAKVGIISRVLTTQTLTHRAPTLTITRMKIETATRISPNNSG